MKLRAYAKVNLTLDIIEKLPDNYHKIDSIMQQVSLYDEIEIEEIEENKILLRCNIKELENDKNLAFKAASLIKKMFDIHTGIKIDVNKNIPVGAGLSGGSSDAAAVLKILDVIWKLGLEKDGLSKLAAEIGMDVAFHIDGGIARCTSKGEKIEILDDIDEMPVVIVNPGFEVSTKDAYGSLDLKECNKEGSTSKAIADLKNIKDHLHNDFEQSIFKRYPEIEKIKKTLKGYTSYTIMSGSGASVFGLFDKEEDAKKAYDELKERYKNIFLTRTRKRPKIEVAQSSGFCLGVKRSIDCALEIKKNADSIGPLVHNSHVIKELEKKGIKVIESIDDVEHDTVIIRAHGVKPGIIQELQKKQIEVIDLTCPFVKKVHEYAKELEQEGYSIVIIGEKHHPEVEGILGNVKHATVIEDKKEAEKFDLDKKLGVVVQTTQSLNNVDEIMEILNKKAEEVRLCNTICNSTTERQQASVELAKKSDIMIVVGGYNSGNTKRLKDICSNITDTKHIESADEIKAEWFFDKTDIGITAGASTPHHIIDEVKQSIGMII